MTILTHNHKVQLEVFAKGSHVATTAARPPFVSALVEDLKSVGYRTRNLQLTDAGRRWLQCPRYTTTS